MKDKNIFTIGDLTNKGIIKSFEIHKGTNIDECVAITEQGKFGIKAIEHFKQPLFTTSDNVEIFVGDEYWFVNRWGVYNKTASEGTYLDLEDYYFSSKAKAEEYVLMNKPCLSLNDILNSNLKFNPKRITVVKDKLRKLVKQKLKQ